MKGLARSNESALKIKGPSIYLHIHQPLQICEESLRLFNVCLNLINRNRHSIVERTSDKIESKKTQKMLGNTNILRTYTLDWMKDCGF